MGKFSVILLLILLLIPSFLIGTNFAQENDTYFKEIFFDGGIDINSDELYDYLVFSVEVNIGYIDEYITSVELFSENGKFIETSENITTLDVGIQIVNIYFNGTKLYSYRQNGTFNLINLTLFDSSGKVIDHKNPIYDSKYYHFIEFNRPRIFFSGNFNESPIDIDNNSYFDILRYEIEVNVSYSGNYSVIGTFVDLNANFTSEIEELFTLEVGVYIITIDIKGGRIYSGRNNGSFIFSILEIIFSYPFTDTPPFYEVIDNIEHCYKSQPYNFTDFKRPITYFISNYYRDIPIDIDQNGLNESLDINLKVNVGEPGTYHMSGLLYSINNVFIDFFSSTQILVEGINTINLNFSGTAISDLMYSGNFIIKSIKIINSSYYLMDWLNSIYTENIYKYSQFEISPTKIISFSDFGKDINNNSKFENLTINVNININQSGDFTLFGCLKNYFGEIVDTCIVNDHFNSRVQTISLDFSGLKIYQTYTNNSINIFDLTLSDKQNKVMLDERDMLLHNIYNYTDFENPLVIIREIFNEEPIDLNGDGFYELLKFSLSLETLASENYRIISYLYNEFNDRITSLDIDALLKEGTLNIYLEFNCRLIWNHRINGKYEVKIIEIYDKNLNIIGERKMNYFTSFYNYTQFQPPSAYFTGNFEDYGEDLDKDGRFGGLQLNSYVNVTESGEYIIEASLFSQDNIYLDKVSTTMNLGIGTHIIPIMFSGQKLRIKEKAGPYLVSYVKITNSTGAVIDSLNEPHITASYNSTQFEDAEVIPKSSEEEDSATMIIILAVVIIAIFAVALIILLRRRAQGT